MQWYFPFQTVYLTFTVLFLTATLLYYLRFRRVGRLMRTERPVFWGKFIVRSIYIALIITSLLGPSFGKSKKEVTTLRKDIFLLMDLSASMNASDIQPSRLERAKFEMLQWIEKWKADRIGLIVFTDEAFLQCPLTYDKNALIMYVKSLNTDMMSRNGTNIGDGLTMAVNKLEMASGKKNSSGIIILLTDGEDFGEALTSVGASIKNKNIRLFTIGIGTSAGGRILQNGQWKKDKKGNIVISQTNSSLLKILSEVSGGKYFEINEPSSSTESLMESVDSIKATWQDSEEIDISSNKYDYFLLPALLLLMIDIIVTIRVIEL